MRSQFFIAGFILLLLLAGCTQPRVSAGSLRFKAGGDYGQGGQAPGAIPYRPQLLTQVAALLAEEGLFNEDGQPVYGYPLQRSLATYQRLKNLPITAEIDRKTLADLELKIGAGGPLLSPAARLAGFPRLEPGPLVRLDLTHEYRNPGEDGVAWRHTLDPGLVGLARLYFAELQLSDGQTLLVRDSAGAVQAEFTGAGAGWQEKPASLPLTIEITGPAGSGGGTVRISRVQVRRGLDQKKGTWPGTRETGSTFPLGHLAPGHPAYQKGAAVAALIAGSSSFCSGFLIDTDLLLTAAHCVTTQAECEETAARFNFQEDKKGYPLIPADYPCRELVRINPELGYAVLQLEGAPGDDWGYAELRPEPAVPDGSGLFLIGHPAGLPKRIGFLASTPSVTGKMKAPASGRAGTWSSGGSPLFEAMNFQVTAMAAGDWPPASGSSLLPASRILADCPECRPPLELSAGTFDVDGDGRTDLFYRFRNSGAGVLRSTGNGFETGRLQENWLDQWNLGATYQVLPADLDGDGPDDLIAVSPGWIALFKGDQGRLALHWMTHEQVGGWRLEAGDRPLLGDFNGDGLDDLLLHNGRRLLILLGNGNRFGRAIIMDGKAGEWQLGPDDRFWVGRFSGENQDSLLVRNARQAGLLQLGAERLVSAWKASDWLGYWNLAPGDRHLVGDVNGDGRDDLLTFGNQRLSLWLASGKGFKISWIKEGSLGPWQLNWQDRPVVGDFNGDSRADLLLSSQLGLALFLSDGKDLKIAWTETGELGWWRFGPAAGLLAGDFNGDGKTDVLLNNRQWLGRFVSNGTTLYQDFLAGGLNDSRPGLLVRQKVSQSREVPGEQIW